MGKLVTLLLFMPILQGLMVESVPYDHTASLECMGNPMGPLYNGGIIQNSQFNQGLMGWSAPWGVQATVSTSPSGNKFAAARCNGARPARGVTQKLQMQSDTHYALSAWLQVSNGSAVVKATVKAPNGAFVTAGAIVAKAGCWTMLKGGMSSNSTGPAELFFEADAAVDIMVDSVALQPFSFDDWATQRAQSTAKVRRNGVRVVTRSAAGAPLANATVRVALTRPAFPFGNAMTAEILSNPAYEQWFTSRFTVATFENEMKWYSTEPSAGHETYAVADAMLALAEKHGIRVRGHNVLWDSKGAQMPWVAPLNATALSAAVRRRMESVMRRYQGKVIGWDVVNENLHYDFFERALGPDASPRIFGEAAALCGGGEEGTPLFMNEFNTLEQAVDGNAIPTKYAAKFEQIKSYPGNGGVRLAVGLESHFGPGPNIPYMRAGLDTLAQLGAPIWLTEVDVGKGPSQAADLEAVLREGYAHPAVQGIVMWAAWHARGCYAMCLTDNSFKNLPVGDVVDKLIAEWTAHPGDAVTDASGAVALDLVDGQYSFTVTHPSLEKPVVHAVTVAASSSAAARVIDIQV